MLKMLGVAVGLTLGSLAHAVGLGGINVVSALGQPLKAEIELVAVSKEDKPGMVARLASPEAYKGAGLEYPMGVKYQFKVESRANGDPYLRLTSNQDINDPFVSLLVELSWSSGRLMREYTFLLDPPGYSAVMPKQTAVQAVAPAAPQPVAQPAPQAAAPAAAPAPKPVTSAPAAKPVERPKPVAAAPEKVEQPRPSHVATGTITVKSGDTLSKIAAQIKPEEVSLERMLVALYRANSDQFDSGNMNRIRTGKVLRQPEQGELDGLSQSEALQEIRAQAADWNAYRQKLAGAASTSAASETPRQVATGKITTAATDKTPVASESAKEVLRLSKGETPGDKVASGAAGRAGTAAAHDAAAEEAIAKGKAVEEEKKRAALLENNLKDMKRLAELKTDAASLAAAASGVEAASAVAPASAVEAVSAVAPASAVKAAKPAQAPASYAEPSFVDELMASPELLGGVAVALAGLGGLALMWNRRRNAASAASGDEADIGESTIGASTGHLTEPVAPSPDTGDFTVGESTAEVHAVAHDEVDPISEADLFLNFGRDEQAEQVLKDALQRTPDNHQIHLKLLGIYANRQDVESFLVIENQLQRSGDEEAIRQAAVIGQRLGLGAGVEDADSATAFMPKPDFSEDPLLASPAKGEEAVAEQVSEPVVDFDLTGAFPAVEEPKEVDFDVTSTHPSMPAPDMMDFDISKPSMNEAETQHEELPNLDDLIFDVTSTSTPALQVETAAESEAAASPEVVAADSGMDFMLDFPMDEVKDETAAPLPEINLADISLDMDDEVAAATESVQDKDEAVDALSFEMPEPEVAAQEPALQDISIPDFALDEVPAAAPVETEAMVEAAPVEEAPLLDIPVDAAPIDAAELWQEVATKIDLARAYQEMGDEVGAREILEEVMMDGDEAQKQEAQQILNQLA